jgi:hypothetical protein
MGAPPVDIRYWRNKYSIGGAPFFPSLFHTGNFTLSDTDKVSWLLIVGSLLLILVITLGVSTLGLLRVVGQESVLAKILRELIGDDIYSRLPYLLIALSILAGFVLRQIAKGRNNEDHM